MGRNGTTSSCQHYVGWPVQGRHGACQLQLSKIVETPHPDNARIAVPPVDGGREAPGGLPLSRAYKVLHGPAGPGGNARPLPRQRRGSAGGPRGAERPLARPRCSTERRLAYAQGRETAHTPPPAYHCVTWLPHALGTTARCSGRSNRRYARTKWLPGCGRKVGFRDLRRVATARAGVPPFSSGFPAFAARSSTVQQDGRKRRSCSPS